jgi:hypothetical protein
MYHLYSVPVATVISLPAGRSCHEYQSHRQCLTTLFRKRLQHYQLLTISTNKQSKHNIGALASTLKYRNANTWHDGKHGETVSKKKKKSKSVFSAIS